MTARKPRVSTRKAEKKPMLYSALNYRWMGIGCLLVIVGFTAMYLENEVYGPISLYLSPVLIITGYLLVIYAILVNEEEQPDPDAGGRHPDAG